MGPVGRVGSWPVEDRPSRGKGLAAGGSVAAGFPVGVADAAGRPAPQLGDAGLLVRAYA